MTNFLSRIVSVIVAGFIVVSSAFASDNHAIPALSAGDPSAPTKLEFFLSPTCPMCAATFRNTVLPLLSVATRGAPMFVFVGILPRSEKDVNFARGLSCVPQDQLLPFMTRWYFYRRTGEAKLSKLFELGREHGIEGSTVAACTTDRNDAMLLSLNQLIFVKQGIHETPAVFLNGKHLPDTFYLWQLEDLVPDIVTKTNRE